jgi:hypothetical protein
MSFVEKAEATAVVVAEEPCDIQVIEGEHVLGLIESVPGFGTRFYRTLAMQLAQRLRKETASPPPLLIERVSQARQRQRLT